ncbi:ankyrin repeat domain-containing protein [archaeon]|nr:MAG: ankyrin repeat domain-containing protein [archaeon]
MFIQGSRGNTPLHFACLLEKPKIVELLLEYGARPDAVNQYNQTPLQMLPRNVVPSTKLAMKKMFDEAFAKMRPQLGSPSDNVASHRNDL